MAENGKTKVEVADDVQYVVDQYMGMLNENPTLRQQILGHLEQQYLYNKPGEEVGKMGSTINEIKDAAEAVGVDVEDVMYGLYERLKTAEPQAKATASPETIGTVEETRGKIGILEESGEVDWLDADTKEIIGNVYGIVTDIHPGDKIVVADGPFDEKVFTVEAHNRGPKVIIAKSEEGEERRFSYRGDNMIAETFSDLRRIEVKGREDFTLNTKGAKALRAYLQEKEGELMGDVYDIQLRERKKATERRRKEQQ